MGEALLTPTKLYIKSVVPLIKGGLVKGLAHITGGGLIENPPRMLPDHLGFELDYSAWKRPAVFDWLAETGGIEESEMRRAFNGGIGLLLAVAADDAEAITVALNDAGEEAFICGQLVAK